MVGSGELSDDLRMQALKHVVALPGSPMAEQGVSYGYDKEKGFMTISHDTSVHYAGFLALNRQTFDRLPAIIDVDQGAEMCWDPDIDHATVSEVRLFNCQEAFYSLPNPKGMELGFYALTQAELVSKIPYRGLPFAIPRLLRALGRMPNTVQKAQLDAAKEGRRLTKEAKADLWQQAANACPVVPTFGMRVAKLSEGTLVRLGAVHPIRHNAGKYR